MCRYISTLEIDGEEILTTVKVKGCQFQGDPGVTEFTLFALKLFWLGSNAAEIFQEMRRRIISFYDNFFMFLNVVS